MTEGEEKIGALRARASGERARLADAIAEARLEADSFRKRWRLAGWAASGLAAAATAAWKLFGKNSLAARAGRIASAASLLLGLSRGVRRIWRIW